MLVNLVWLDVFAGSEASFLTPGVSDHTPMIVQLGISLHHRALPFKFFNFWVNNPSFLEIVNAAWSKPVWGSPLYRFSQRLKWIKLMLKNLNREQYSDLHHRSETARQSLFNCQTKLQSHPGDPDLKDQERTAISNLIKFSSTEEALLH